MTPFEHTECLKVTRKTILWTDFKQLLQQEEERGLKSDPLLSSSTLQMFTGSYSDTHQNSGSVNFEMYLQFSQKKNKKNQR